MGEAILAAMNPNLRALSALRGRARHLLTSSERTSLPTRPVGAETAFDRDLTRVLHDLDAVDRASWRR
jgi:hypothetical protein